MNSSDKEVTEKGRTPELDVKIALEKPMQMNDPTETESAADTCVGCQCSIEGQMEPDDTSILVSFKFPDKDYDGEVEDAAQLVSTLDNFVP